MLMPTNNAGARMYIARWQKVAIVFSIAWIVGSGAYKWSALTTRAHSKALSEYENCIEIDLLTHNPEIGLCSQRASRALADELNGTWHDVAVVALAPVIVMWIAILLILMVRRTIEKRI